MEGNFFALPDAAALSGCGTFPNSLAQIRNPPSGWCCCVSSAIENPTHLRRAKHFSQFPGLIWSKSMGLTGFNPARVEWLCSTGAAQPDRQRRRGSESSPGATGRVKMLPEKTNNHPMLCT